MQLIQSKYPNCTLDVIDDDALDPAGNVTYAADLTLSPSLFPILRFEQFEDLLERQLEDPLELLLDLLSKHATQIQIGITPVGRRQLRSARKAIKVLDRPFFRSHFQIAELYAGWITRPWLRLVVWPFRLLAARRDDRIDSKTDSTASRHGDRTDDLQAANDKIGGHLFNVRIRLIVSTDRDEDARRLIRETGSAFAAFTLSRLALFRLGSIRRQWLRSSAIPTRRKSFLLSHVELATLFQRLVAR